jgi:hypothetical protein
VKNRKRQIWLLGYRWLGCKRVEVLTFCRKAIQHQIDMVSAALGDWLFILLHGCKQIDIWRIYMNLEILREYNFIITYISSLTPNTYRSVHLYCHSLWESDKCEVLSLLGSRYKLSLSILPNTKHISMVFCFSSWVCNRQTPPPPPLPSSGHALLSSFYDVHTNAFLTTSERFICAEANRSDTKWSPF